MWKEIIVDIYVLDFQRGVYAPPDGKFECFWEGMRKIINIFNISL